MNPYGSDVGNVTIGNIVFQGDDEMSNDRTAIICTFSWGTESRPNPHLIFEFHKDIHPENVQEIALTMARTAIDKVDCLDFCALEPIGSA